MFPLCRKPTDDGSAQEGVRQANGMQCIVNMDWFDVRKKSMLSIRIYDRFVCIESKIVVVVNSILLN